MHTLTYSGSTSPMSLVSGGLPLRIPLHPFGEFFGNGRRFLFDEASLAAVREQLAAQGRPWVLDWHHATLHVEEGKRDKAPAAAFVRDVVVEDGYVYGLVEEWTAEGAADVASGAYGYISPVLLHTEDGHIVGYHSHALTNRPGTQWQRRIGLEDTMDWLKQLLGLAHDATAEQVKAALEALLAKAGLGELLGQALELADFTLTPELRGRIIRLAASEGVLEEIKHLRGQLEADRRERATSRIASLVEAALEDGRILESQKANFLRLAALDYEGTRAALEAMPKQVPTKLPKVGLEDDQARSRLNDSDLVVAKIVGVSEETLRTYGGED
ncbi:phage protease [Meiothermus sp.]|uniref:phage protease n=1 Tax=Meiothermus sp. TaxID=1955249 RepID=UPI00307EB2DD